MMKKRDAVNPKAKSLGLRRAFLVLLPVVLASGAWKIRQLQQPIDVQIPSPGLQINKEDGSFSVKKQKTPVFRQLVVRLVAEQQKHPFAASISVSQITPWPKESGLNLVISESLVLERTKGTLRYTTDNYGWTYSHVESEGLGVLSKAHLPDTPITLANSLNSKLHSYGWTLTEHYLP